MRAAAVEHAATFSWAHTVDALQASYGRAIDDYRVPPPTAGGAVAAHRPPVLHPARDPRMTADQSPARLADNPALEVIEATLKEAELEYAFHEGTRRHPVRGRGRGPR